MIDAYDVETESMASIAGSLTIQQKMYWPQIYRGIRERVAMFTCGRQQAPEWIRKELKAYDPLLDIRWNYEDQGWTIERYSRKDRAWAQVMFWNDNLDARVMNALREGDMWRFSTSDEYLKYKREKSAAIRAGIRKNNQEKLCTAIDSLTRKQAEEFVEVERALKTGETVLFAGESGKQIDRMIESERKAMARGDVIDTSKVKTLRPMKKSRTIH